MSKRAGQRGYFPSAAAPPGFGGSRKGAFAPIRLWMGDPRATGLSMSTWQAWQLPDDLTGLTFLDIGCWEGTKCVEAVERNARRVVGVDLCTCDTLRRNVQHYGFEFLQLDVFSEKFLHLEQFDLVLCAGVLYHVENVLSLLTRLRHCTRQRLVLETAVHRVDEEKPILLFHPGEDLDANPSNWWTPNLRCLEEMLVATGFATPRLVHQTVVQSTRTGETIYRACVHTEPASVDLRKAFPRHTSLMSLQGGERSAPPLI